MEHGVLLILGFLMGNHAEFLAKISSQTFCIGPFSVRMSRLFSIRIIFPPRIKYPGFQSFHRLSFRIIGLISLSS